MNSSSLIEASAGFQLARVYQPLDRKEEAQHLLAHLQQRKASSAVSSGETAAPSGSIAPSARSGPAAKCSRHTPNSLNNLYSAGPRE